MPKCSWVFLLIGVALYMNANPWSLNCNEMTLSCPVAFQKMLDDVTNTSDAMLAQTQKPHIDAYCTCLQSCLTYASVWENKKTVQNPTNCFPLSAAAGIPETASNVPAQPPATGVAPADVGQGESLIPGTDSMECISCGDLQSHQMNLMAGLSGLAALCGVALMITAGCEHLELKWHGAAYATCVLVTDLLAGVLLVIGTIIGMTAATVAYASCNPEGLQAQTKDMGNDSTNMNDNQSKAFAEFLVATFLPVVASLCKLKGPLSMYAFTGALGCFGSMVSFFASCCVCMHCSDDGMDGFDDDHRAVQLQGLMSGNKA